MSHIGDFDASAVVYGKFTTYRPSSGATYTLGGTPALSVYKDNSTTQSTTGVTLTADFDSVTGLNHFAIDTSADGTFYSAGSFFDVVITTGTVDGVSVTGSVVASFTIRKNSALKPATAGRTLVVDASGLADANTVKVGPTGSGTAQTARDIGASVLLSAGTGTGQLDFTSGVVKGNVTQWLGTTVSTPTVAGVPNVNAKTWNDLATVALPLVPTVAGRTLDVSAGGEAGVDWANVGSPTTSLNLSGTTISTTQAVASVSGAVASVTGNVGGNVTGSVGSVVGAVGSVTGNVGGNVLGSLATLTGFTPADITTIKTTTNKLDTTLQSAGGSPGDWEFSADALRHAPTGSGGGSAPSAAAIADAVWDEILSGHVISGSAGEALTASGGAGDPWITALPGSYSAGQAGYIVGTNLNATISSRASQASLDTLDDYVDSEVAAIKAKTDNLPAAPAALGDIPTAIENADALLNRDMSSGTDSGSPTVRTVRQALRFLRNKWSISGSTLTVTKEDDTTASWTSTVSTTAGADPVTGNDPA